MSISAGQKGSSKASNPDLEGAMIIPEGEAFAINPEEPSIVKVRVPGVMVSTCKEHETDCVPCILVEWFKNPEDPFDEPLRFLCHEVGFLGYTNMRQSVAEPCDLTGAILWLETIEPLVLHGYALDITEEINV